MLHVQLQHPALYHLGGNLLPVNADKLPLAATDLHHQLHIPLDGFPVVGVLGKQDVIVDIFFYQFPVSIHRIHPILPALPL